jgi:hypothetical protein
VPHAANWEAGLAEYVHKLRAVAWVSEQGEEEALGYFALTPHAQFHTGPETLLERLNSSDRVIPFHLHEHDGVLLLNRLEIQWVMPVETVPAELVCPQTYQVTREERVRLRLRSGETLEGLLRMELPEWFNRASDFLNSPEHFFPLVTERGVVLVNKLCVSSTRLYEASPEPVTDP